MFRWHLVTALIFTTLTCFLAQPAKALSLSREYPCCEVVSQALQYNQALHKWWFTGKVIEVRHIHMIGMPARVAWVQSVGFRAWVFLSFETDKPSTGVLSLGKARAGDQVEVSITGPHALNDHVNWDLCEPRLSPYCSYGWLYDAGPFSPDWQVMLSPSNEFIHYGHPNLSWEQALFWNTEKLSFDDDNTPGFSTHLRDSGNPKPRRSGCLALRAGDPNSCHWIAVNDAACLPFLVESPITRGAQQCHAGGNLSLAKRTAFRAGRVGVPPGADGNLLAGNSDIRFLQFFE